MKGDGQAPSGHTRDPGLAVLVVVGHRLVAESVARLLPRLDGVRTAFAATTLAGARGSLRRGRFDLALVSEVIEGESVLELVATTAPAGRRPAVLVLAAAPDPRRAAKALHAGAWGWVSDDSSAEELAEALATVRSGRHWVPPQLRSDVIDALVAEHSARPLGDEQLRLSARQQEVLGCLVAGMSHGEVAESLQVSVNTVRSHVRHMCRSTGVHSTPALVALARHGRLLTSTQDVRPRPR
jgi:DNA-binding NarL/FixJ family response regulator